MENSSETAAWKNSRLWSSTLASRPEDPHEEPREVLRREYQSFRKRAALLTQEIPRYLPDYTVHDVTHLDALWEMASLIAGKDVPLTPTEAYVLGGAILIHDAGMALAAYPGGLEELRKLPRWSDTVAALLRARLGRAASPQELSAPPPDVQNEVVESLLRELHAEQAEKLTFVEWSAGGTSYRLIETPELRNHLGWIIGKIAHSHWWSVDELRSRLPSAPLNPPSGHGFPSEWTVDALKVACLLRVADASHLDSRRAPGQGRALRRPQGVSDKHWGFQEKLSAPRVENGRLLYTSRPFALEHAEEWWLCMDALRMVDRELRQVDALLADTGRARLEARGVVGVDEPSRLTEIIPVEGWKPVDARIRITDVPSLVERLGGKQLYGSDSTIPLRELIQNASDAVRARRCLESRGKDWGEIIVRLGEDQFGPWIEVEDNGVGMRESVLAGALLDFGKSFWSTAEARKEFPGLLSRGFNPEGQYGIGFFSVFMWGQRVRVTSLRLGEAFKDTLVLELLGGPRERPILRPAREEERLRDSGTRVRVWTKAAHSVMEVLPRERQTLRSLCEWLCPTLEVTLFTEEPGHGRQQVLRGSDWIDMEGKALLTRLHAVNPRLKEAEEELALYAARIQPIHLDSGEIIGRACIAPHLIRSPYDWLRTAPVTIGGLRADSMQDVAGVLTGRSQTVARNSSTVPVSDAEWARWASAQGKQLAAMVRPASEEAYQCACAVRRFGGQTGMLPVAWSHQGWVSASDLAQWKDVREVLLIKRFVWLGRKLVPDSLALQPFVLFTPLPQPGTLSWVLAKPDAPPPTPEQLLAKDMAGAIIEALAMAWSTTVQAILRCSDPIYGEGPPEREVGSLQGKPLHRAAFAIRRP